MKTDDQTLMSNYLNQKLLLANFKKTGCREAACS